MRSHVIGRGAVSLGQGLRSHVIGRGAVSLGQGLRSHVIGRGAVSLGQGLRSHEGGRGAVSLSGRSHVIVLVGCTSANSRRARGEIITRRGEIVIPVTSTGRHVVAYRTGGDGCCWNAGSGIRGRYCG